MTHEKRSTLACESVCLLGAVNTLYFVRKFLCAMCKFSFISFDASIASGPNWNNMHIQNTKCGEWAWSFLHCKCLSHFYLDMAQETSWQTVTYHQYTRRYSYQLETPCWILPSLYLLACHVIIIVGEPGLSSVMSLCDVN